MPRLPVRRSAIKMHYSPPLTNYDNRNRRCPYSLPQSIANTSGATLQHDSVCQWELVLAPHNSGYAIPHARPDITDMVQFCLLLHITDPFDGELRLCSQLDTKLYLSGPGANAKRKVIQIGQFSVAATCDIRKSKLTGCQWFTE